MKALTMELNTVVTFLLLLAAGSLCGGKTSIGRCALGAMLSGIYAGVCMLGDFGFLGAPWWRVAGLAVTAWTAFGGGGTLLRRGAVFALLSLASEGLSAGVSGNWTLLPAAIGVWLLSRGAFSGDKGGRRYVPVRLRYGERSVQLLALRDTGNILRDPVSGEAVMVLGAEAAQRLTGLTSSQLKSPVETVASGVLPGLRLLPYRVVGGSGLMAALRLDEVWINGKPAARLTAFAPEGLDGTGTIQALTGGIV